MLSILPHWFPASDWEVTVILHSNDRPACELLALLGQTDLLLTAHGFQSMLFLFLPIPAMIFEIFPHHYYKQVYRQIAHSYGRRELLYLCAMIVIFLSVGIVHGYVIAEPVNHWYSWLFSIISHQQCMKLLLCRAVARSQNLRYCSDI